MPVCPRDLRPAAALLALLLASARPATADDTRAEADALADLPLEELMRVEIVSAGRKTQALGDVAAAVFVITQDDIQRSGARSLPEALRLAPGVDAAQLSAGRTAVGVRGGSARFANTLQVLVDGRSIYSPLFSGVLWETERVPLDTIDRIEVIRGPAGAVWGANAVNGVINILTKPAGRTQGGRASVSAGSDGQARAYLRQGQDLTLDSHLRLWAQHDQGGPSATPDGPSAGDRYQVSAAGLRYDRGLEGGAQLSLQAQLTHSVVQDRWTAFDLSAPTLGTESPTRQTLSRAVFMGHLRRHLDDGSELRLQASLSLQSGEQTRLAEYEDQILDLDLQHRWQPVAGHDLIWGAGLKWYHDRIGNTDSLRFDPDSRNQLSWSLYAQDDHTLVPDRWTLTYGLRLDRHPETGVATQPNLRLLHRLDADHSLWAAVSRAVRVPSRAEADATVDVRAVPAAPPLLPLPLRVQLVPATSLGSEKVTAVEAGWRGQLSSSLSLDATAFVHRYRSTSQVPPTAQVVGPVFTPAGAYLLANLSVTPVQADTRGLELAADWRVRPGWRLQASYALTDVDDADAREAGGYMQLSGTPRHLLSLRSSLDLRPDLSLDAWLRHVGKRDYVDGTFEDIAARTTLNLNLRWRVRPSLTVAAAGLNLGGRRQEIAQDYGFSPPTEAEPALQLSAHLSY